jgi:predicted nucleotidyltransferase
MKSANSDDGQYSLEVLSNIETQLNNRINKKRMWNAQKNSPFAIARRIRKLLAYMISRHRNTHKSILLKRGRFGYDEFGRDIEAGLLVYLKMLFDRSLKIHSLLLLGSRAKERYSTRSDIDVLLITDNKFELRKDKKKISDAPLFMGIEAEHYTKKEIESMMKKLDLTFLDAVYWGIVIFDDGYWKKILENYSELEERLRLPRKLIKKKLRQI